MPKIRLKKKFEIVKEEKFFDEHPHQITDSAFRFTLDVWVLSKICQFKPNKILDIGCGAGKVKNYYRNSTHDSFTVWVGIDSRDLKNVYRGKNTEFIQQDLRNPFSALLGNQEFIVCAEVLEHFTKEDSCKILDRVLKLLKPGGHLIITTPGPEDFDIYTDSRKFGHFWSPKIEILDNVFQKNNCKVLECWNGRFFGEGTRIEKLRKSIELHYGKEAVGLVEHVAKRFHPRVALAIFLSAIEVPKSHIQCVVERLK